MNFTKNQFAAIATPLRLALFQLVAVGIAGAQLPTPLVQHGETWHYRKGTSEPAADWASKADAALDATWLSGAGGFGYDDGDDTTVLDDMMDSYVTVYMRRSFDITAAMDSTRHLQLTADFDDGAIVYLAGTEVWRSSNVPGAAGTIYAFDDTTLTANREASAGAGGETPEVIDLGTLASNLGVGTHVLAVQGLNGAINSSDLSMIFDLDLVDAPPPPMDVTWTLADSPVTLTSDFNLDPGATLTIEAGVEVVLSAGVDIVATEGGHIDIAGTAAEPVVLRPSGGSDWGAVSATGAGGTLTIRHAEISGGRVLFLTSVTGLMEDTYIHDSGASSMINAVTAASVTLRRCRVANYAETLFRTTLTVLECCLFEDSTADSVDFDAAVPGSTIRQCTFSGGAGGNTDAIDIGPTGGVPSRDVIIEDCIMHDFGDKGVSIGDGPSDAENIIVRNCLIYNVARGVQVKHASTTIVHDCTIVDSEIGLHGFEKSGGTGGGIFPDTYNNIMSGVADPIETEVDTVIVVESSDTQGVDYPGTGNINADPLFRDPANRDYRLLPGSPCIGSGRAGANMGVTFPIGGRPDVPADLHFVSFDGSQAVVAWTDPGDKESEFIVEQSTDGTVWTTAANTAANVTGATLTGLDGSPAWFFRVRSSNFLGASFNSDPIDTDDLDGDGLPNSYENSVAGLDPNDPSDAAGDLDDDGATNLGEFEAGTDPLDPNSFLRLDAIVPTLGDQVELQFTAQPDKSYTVQFSETLEPGSWQFVANVPADPTLRPAVSAFDTPPANAVRRFYRVATPQLP